MEYALCTTNFTIKDLYSDITAYMIGVTLIT